MIKISFWDGIFTYLITYKYPGLYQYSTVCDNRFACYPGINVSENITTLKKLWEAWQLTGKDFIYLGLVVVLNYGILTMKVFVFPFYSWSHGANIWEQRCKNYCTYFLCPKTSSDVVRICDLWCFSVPMSCWRHNLQVIINTVCSWKKKIQNIPLEV